MSYVLYENFGQYAGGRSAHCKVILLDNCVVLIQKLLLDCDDVITGLGVHV